MKNCERANMIPNFVEIGYCYVSKYHNRPQLFFSFEYNNVIAAVTIVIIIISLCTRNFPFANLCFPTFLLFCNVYCFEMGSCCFHADWKS